MRAYPTGKIHSTATTARKIWVGRWPFFFVLAFFARRATGLLPGAAVVRASLVAVIAAPS